MKKNYSCLVLCPDDSLIGMECYLADDFSEAVRLAVEFALVQRGEVLRVEVSDFGIADPFK